MIKHLNDPLKELVSRVPQDFVKWLKPHYTFDKEMPTHLARTDVDLDTDLLCRVLYKGSSDLFHIQFQRHNDPEADLRLLEYNVMTSIEHDLVTCSTLIYLKQEPFVAESPFIQPSSIGGEDILRFYYQTVKLWEIPTETILQADIEGILPLVPFTREGVQHQAIDEVIGKLNLVSKQSKADLLSLTYQLASLAYTSPADSNWLRERFAMIGIHNV